MHCDNIDECLVKTHKCHTKAICNDTQGSYHCNCELGYIGNGSFCENVDECSNSSHKCHQNASCVDTDGSYACFCNKGYTGEGYFCVDIDECNSTNSCSKHASCVNNEGSYSCYCKVRKIHLMYDIYLFSVFVSDLCVFWLSIHYISHLFMLDSAFLSYYRGIFCPISYPCTIIMHRWWILQVQ